MGEADLPEPVWLPHDHGTGGSLWLGTRDTSEHGPFLQAFLKFHLWAKTSHDEACYVHTGVSDSTRVLRFTYSDWASELLYEDYKHVFISDKYYYQGPEYSSTWLRQQLCAVLDDLVSSLYKKLLDA